jgi:RNA polymerase sigma-70 factor (ECF subfamily)
LRLSRGRTVAEDLLDETWLRLVRHAGSLRADTRLAAWLFTVARNLYWTDRRSAVTEEAGACELLTLWPAPGTWPSPFDLASAGELERRVERALATLSPQHGKSCCSSATKGIVTSALLHCKDRRVGERGRGEICRTDRP